MREPVDAEEVLAAAHERAAAHRVGHPHGHPVVAQVTWVGLEKPSAGGEIPGLEQRDDHRQQAEAARIVIGPGDEREDLELVLQRRAVAGQHVHPVVLGQQRGSGPRKAGVDEAAVAVEVGDAAAERPDRQPFQRAPLARQPRILGDRRPGLRQRVGVQGAQAIGVDGAR